MSGSMSGSMSGPGPVSPLFWCGKTGAKIYLYPAGPLPSGSGRPARPPVPAAARTRPVAGPGAPSPLCPERRVRYEPGPDRA